MKESLHVNGRALHCAIDRLDSSSTRRAALHLSCDCDPTISPVLRRPGMMFIATFPNGRT
jgi:hypothetical protein